MEVEGNIKKINKKYILLDVFPSGNHQNNDIIKLTLQKEKCEMPRLQNSTINSN